ncbi:translation initiation factor eIF-2B subunit family protein [Xylariaceae sp. FL0594]|nr:translation initiation factor eIF-2B subunit family protein [Xylariaceae sp. FL0594]
MLRCLQRTTPLGHVRQLGGSTRAMASSSAKTTDNEITKRAVAGSFLFTIPNGDDKQARVALFRRSAKVRTYQHKLAPCSGSVEEDDANPLATALREINEETTLTESSLDLLRVGKPYSFVDEALRREWTINPFAFRLKDASEGGKGEEGIQLDWEHDGIEWFDPREVNGSDKFGGVPNLITSLRRVWPEYDLGFEAGKALTEGLQRLRDDHEHGARELATMAVTTLRDVIGLMGQAQPADERWWTNVRMVAWHICQSRPSIGASITTAIVKALDAIKMVYTTEMTTEEKTQSAVKALDEQLAQRVSTTEQIKQTFLDYIRSNVLQGKTSKDSISILTLSSSSTIAACLQATSSLDVSLDLRALESRPLYEAVTLASKLLEKAEKDSRLKITIYSDASAALAAKDIDLFLIGADRVSSAGDVSNKIGSLPALLSAKHVSPNAKVVVLTDTDKVAGPGSVEEHPSEENDPSELIRAWKGNVRGAETFEDALQNGDSRVAVKNAYFEWIPANLVDAYVTEEGVWDRERIESRSDWIGKEVKEYFEEL